jgi:signal peptide peptidase SppA
MYEHIVKAIFETPWAIEPSKLNAIVEFIRLKSAGMDIDYKAEVSRPRAAKQGKVAVIPVHGVIMQRANMMSEYSGGTSTEMLKAQINESVNDQSVKSIVLDIDSPGGSVYGVQEVSDFIYSARQSKHITAVANSLAASAAYWIASSASEFVVTPGGDVGSIGVYTAHQDVSALENSMGVKTTLISAGKKKVEGNPYEPLSDEAKASIQARVDEYYEVFVKAVARNRGVNADAVRNGFGEGAVVSAKTALAGGMVDRISTLDDVLIKLGANPVNLRAAKVKMI